MAPNLGPPVGVVVGWNKVASAAAVQNVDFDLLLRIRLKKLLLLLVRRYLMTKSISAAVGRTTVVVVVSAAAERGRGRMCLLVFDKTVAWVELEMTAMLVLSS